MPFDASTSAHHADDGEVAAIHITSKKHAAKFQMFMAIAKMQGMFVKRQSVSTALPRVKRAASVVKLVTDVSRLESIPFWQQGNPDQDTAEAWSARKQVSGG